jgi:hypothetical protein
MGELGALFNPGMRHELEERRSKAMRREEEGNARDGDLRIDLESGVAVINVPGADGGTAEQGPAAAEQSGAAEQVEVAEPGTAADKDQAPPEDRPDHAAADLSTADPSILAATPAAAAADADAAAAPPAQPRPRGKRGLAASSR